MKILFICGSLENGRDGVGDYTRRLAGEIIRQGHSASIIALNDKHISVIEQTEQESDGTKISVLRLPSILANKEKHRKVENFIKEFNPEWLSLQFVPYSFNKRGLPFGLAKQLKRLGKGRKWHIMFHELWVESKKTISKDTVVQHLQTNIIRNLIKKLKPECVHTNISYYKKQLNEIGINADLLGLFGNISNSQNSIEKSDLMQILYFGGIPIGNSKQILLEKLTAFSRNFKKKFRIITVAPDSKNKEDFIASVQEKLGKSVEIITYSFLSEEEISNLFSSSDVGISRSATYNLGKSGAAIAMLEHGLSLWMPRWDGKTHLDYEFRREIIFADLEDAINNKIKLEYHSLLPDIATLFIEHLK